MQDSKLCQFLRVFSGAEMKRLEAWLLMRHGERAKLMQLFGLLKKYHPDFAHRNLQRETIGRNLFKNPHFRDQDLRLVMSDLTASIEEFASWEVLSQDRLQKQSLLVRFLRDKGLERYLPGELEEYRRRIDAADPFSPEVLHGKLLERLQRSRLQLKSQNSDPDQLLQQASDALDHYFVVEKLRLAIDMLNTQNVYGNAYRYDFLDETLRLATQSSVYGLSPAVQLFLAAYQLLKQPGNREPFDTLVSLLDQHAAQIPVDDQVALYGYALNFCARTINSGQIEFISVLLSLYRPMLDRGLLLENHHLSHRHYKNIVFVGLRAGELEWSRDFIDRYRDQLPPDERENAYRYNLAYYHFFVREFSKTLDLLNEVEFSELIYTLNAKALLLKTFFELDEMEALHALAHSFRALINRNKEVTPFQRELYGQYISYLVKIHKARTRPKEELYALRDALLQESNIADKSWLLWQLEKLF
jgi:hypothetical protein